MPRQSEGKGSTGQRRVDRGVGLVRIMTAGCLGCESWRPMPTDSQSHGLAGQEGRRLSRAPVVAVVPAADLWKEAERWWCDPPGMWRVLRQRVMRPRLVVLRQVPTQDARQFGFIHDDHMVETVASDGADEAFRVRVLPRGTRSGAECLHAHTTRRGGERDKHVVAIVNQVAWGRVFRERLAELLRGPERRSDGR